MTATISGIAVNAGTDPRGSTITAEAIFDPGAQVQPVGFYPTTHALVVSSVTTTADPSTGAWSVELIPNGSMQPTTSYYRFTVIEAGVTKAPVYAVISGDAYLEAVAMTTAPFTPDLSSSGRLIAFTRLLTDWTTSSTSFADVTGAALAVTVGTRPMEIEFYCSWISSNTADRSLLLALFEGATQLTYGGQTFEVVNGISFITLKHTFDVAPSPGLHTYKVQGAMGEAGGNRTVHAAPGFVIPECYMKATEN